MGESDLSPTNERSGFASSLLIFCRRGAEMTPKEAAITTALN
jgi:hypothetical protein